MDTEPWRFPEPPPPPSGAAARPANVTRPLTPREMAEKQRAEEMEQVEVAPGVVITVATPVTAEKRQQLIDVYRDAAYNARGLRAFTSGAFTVEYPQRAMRGGGLVVTQPPTAAFTNGVTPAPVQELQTRLTTRGEAVLTHLLMTWADRANRPVVEPWMTLELRGSVAAPDELPVNLRPDDGGAYWLCGNEVYLWTGGRYRYVTLPAPDPPHVVKRVQDDRGETEIHTWGGDSVMAPRPPRRRVGDNPFSDSNWAAATELSAEDAAKQRREMPEPTDTPAPDADEPLHSHRRYPISEFTAVCACPRCGWIDVHWLRPPELPQPEPEPAVIRECAKCQQEWGEK